MGEVSKNIDINHTFVKTPVRITVDGVNYPITPHNIEVVRKYWDTNDEKDLNMLVNFSLDLGI